MPFDSIWINFYLKNNLTTQQNSQILYKFHAYCVIKLFFFTGSLSVCYCISIQICCLSWFFNALNHLNWKYLSYYTIILRFTFCASRLPVSKPKHNSGLIHVTKLNYLWKIGNTVCLSSYIFTFLSTNQSRICEEKDISFS